MAKQSGLSDKILLLQVNNQNAKKSCMLQTIDNRYFYNILINNKKTIGMLSALLWLQPHQGDQAMKTNIITKILSGNIINFILLCITAMLPISADANLPKAISIQFNNVAITHNRIVIKAPDIAENGNLVNVHISQITGIPDNTYVTELYLFSDFRKKPLAVFRLTANSFVTGLRTRVKMQRTGYIYAVAKLSNGQLISGKKQVKVTLGGCGGGYYYPSGYPYPAYSAHQQEKYHQLVKNSVIATVKNPVSTFSIDVDTSSYANVRRFLMKQGRLPYKDAVRTEELINYFTYNYPSPVDSEVPFSVTTEMGPNPWNRQTKLLHIGLQGYTVPKQDLPAANLVFLIDVSGSMRSHDKLQLLKTSLTMLTNQLSKRDSVSIVVYAGASGVVLKPTSGDQKAVIINALERLRAGGSTNGGSGIKLAYAMARRGFIENGINRVIIATDGDFNVGITNHRQLINLIEKESKSGISLTTLGFGMGNYNDHLMEQLADKGNGNSAYIDNLNEARKVLVDQMSSTLHTIASDVKIQVQFNPDVVSEYRLIGYENRQLKKDDFSNDKVDAGDIGAGHTVTAIYEITLKGSKGGRLDNFRYHKQKQLTENIFSNEVALLRLRFKKPGNTNSQLIEKIITRKQIIPQLTNTSVNYRFSAAVAAFAQRLRNSKYINSLSYATILGLAKQSLGKDPYGYRHEFLNLVSLTSSISH